MWLRSKLAALAGLSRIARWSAGPYVRALVVETAQGVFAVAPEDQGVGRRLRRTGAYGEQELARLARHAGPTSRVLVVGAHVGALAIPVARRCREVVAIEANPDTFALLKMNLALNGVTNCRILSVAANDASGTIRFLQSRTNSGGSKRVPRHRDRRYDYDRPAEISVHAARLDDMLAGERFDVVLMDIEGSEYFALKGMPALLSHCHCLMVEFLPHHLLQVAGITVQEFLSVIPQHFTRLLVPSSGITIARTGAERLLGEMMARGQGDDGLVFTTD